MHRRDKALDSMTQPADIEDGKDGAMLLEPAQGADEVPYVNRTVGVAGRLKQVYNSDPILVWTIVGVIIGIILGLILQATLTTEKTARAVAVRIVGFPGAILLNLLKMMVLPLIAGSMIGGVCALHHSGAPTGRLARRTIAYFAVTTIIAVFIGLAIVLVIRPGDGGLDFVDNKGNATSTTTAKAESPNIVETTFSVLIKMFPPNIVAAAVEMNVLGIITFSLFFGTMLSRVGEQARPMIQLVNVFNDVIMRMVMAILYLAPVGIASLVSSQIAQSSNLMAILSALGKYAFAVFLGLAIHSIIILPSVFFFVTRKNPWTFIKGTTQALATAFGTDSSAATLPVTMMCCERNLGVSPLISKFVLPLGATVNMNGTALYEALTVIFIGQLHGVEMGVGQLLVVAFTSTLAAVGAAAIPSAGLVTMVMVLQSVNLDAYVGDLSLIFTIDWALDRLRTTVNVLGDALGAGIMQHLCGDDLTMVSRNPEYNDVAHGSVEPLITQSGSDGGKTDLDQRSEAEADA